MSEDHNEEEFKKQEEVKIQHEETLKNEQNFIDSELNVLSEETQIEQTRFNTVKTNLKQNITKFKRETVDILDSLEKLAEKNLVESITIASKVARWFSFSIIVFSALFLGVYFVLFHQKSSENAIISFNEFFLDQQSLVVIGSVAMAVIILLVIIRLGSRSIENKITSTSAKIDRDFTKIQNKRPDVSDDLFETGNFFTNVLKKVPLFDSKIKNLVRNSREFVPITDKLYTIMERNNLQTQFRKSMKNALGMYGIYNNPSKELIREIDNASTPSNSELDWVNEAASKIAFTLQTSNLPIDEKIIKAMYYDYTNSKFLSDEWNEIISDDVLCRQFAYILASRTLQIDVSGSYDAFMDLLRKPNVFRLIEFQKKYYDFFVNFQRKKTHMKAVAMQVGIFNDETEHVMNTFFPTNLNEETWDKELAKEICKHSDFDEQYLLLFYYDRIGFDVDSKEIWSNISLSEQNLLDFVEKLDAKKLLKIPEPYRAHKDILTFRGIALTTTKFNFHKFNESIETKFKTIDDVKEKIIHVLEEINPKFTTSEFRDDFASYVPIPDEILSITEHVKQKIGIDSNLVMLFYGAKYDQNISQKYYAKIINENVDLLSEFLIEHELIKIEKSDDQESVKNLSSILQHESRFDLVKIQGMHQRYSHFLEISAKMIEFLHDEKIIDETRLEFEELIKIIKNSGDNRYDNIQAISYWLIDSSQHYPKNSLESISKACCCLFLYTRGDVSAQNACKSVQLDQQASEILYCNMDVIDDKSLVTEKYTLGDIIENVSSNDNLDLKYLSDFKRGLATGYLYSGKKEMMMHKMDSVETEIKKISEIKEELNDMQESLKTVLDTEFEANVGFLEYAIKSQIVQAYMITTKSRGPALTQILDNDLLLQNAAREVDSNIKLENFLIKGTPKQKDPTIGSHTRIGVVPLSIDFDEFSKKFESIYNKAVENYIVQDTSRKKSEFPVNVFRIMTSPATFMPIRLGKQDSSENSDDPLHIIQSLLRKHFSTDDKLSLVTTFNNKSSSVGIREIIEKTCDKNPLYSFVKKELSVAVPNTTTIEQVANTTKFSSDLYQKYNVDNFSKLAILIHNTKKSTSDEQIIGTLLGHINTMFSNPDSQTQKDIEEMAQILFGKLSKFGKILSS